MTDARRVNRSPMSGAVALGSIRGGAKFEEGWERESSDFEDLLPPYTTTATPSSVFNMYV